MPLSKNIAIVYKAPQQVQCDDQHPVPIYRLNVKCMHIQNSYFIISNARDRIEVECLMVTLS